MVRILVRNLVVVAVAVVASAADDVSQDADTHLYVPDVHPWLVYEAAHGVVEWRGGVQCPLHARSCDHYRFRHSSRYEHFSDLIFSHVYNYLNKNCHSGRDRSEPFIAQRL
jgi:hypothetical protein